MISRIKFIGKRYHPDIIGNRLLAMLNGGGHPYVAIIPWSVSQQAEER